jgi:CheY-like chemotaxis protein
MTKGPRKRLASEVETLVLTQSRRRCCLCFVLDVDSSAKPDGQIAHVNHDPANADVDNLVYLCLRHHNLYDSVPSQSKALTAAELKHYRVEMYRSLGTATTKDAPTSPNRSQIRLPAAIRRDCAVHNVKPTDLTNFILGEASRHSMLFAHPFTSLPLVYRQYVLLVSWDLVQVRAERLLDREQAYPLNDVWGACLGLYRRTTLLSYRTRGPHELSLGYAERSVLATYRSLVAAADNYLSLLRRNGRNPSATYDNLEALVEEAEFALANGDVGAAISRLEIVLSTVHKLILNWAPQGHGPIAEREATDVAEVPESSAPSVLVVDDDRRLRELVKLILNTGGYSVTAVGSLSDALRAMIGHDFDLVLTDVVMPGGDGRELALIARRSSQKAKVMAMSGYERMAIMGELGVEEFIQKPFTAESLLRVVSGLVGVSSTPPIT